ncbi:MAG: hypothetical protein WC623_11925 [Pedobacter sp.]|uniref:hypothetical protein n=1 Tax=Pedobacter sp. TaxID=1411316 RepID=UPI00356803E0
MIEKLYYLLYKVVKTTRKNDQPFFNSYLALSFLEFMNLATIFGIVNYFLKYRISEDIGVKATLIIFGAILLYNYFRVWVKKEAIISKYESLPNSNNKLIAWVFIILSFSFFFIVLNNLVEYQPK